MSKIVFDPELMQHIKTIYGEDADLEERTLRQIYNTWKANPEYIRNTAYQKTRLNNSMIEAAPMIKAAPMTAPMPVSAITRPLIEAPQQILNHDLSNIASFGEASTEARRRGLRAFKWRSTESNPSGLFGTQLAESNTTQQVNEPTNTLINTEEVTYDGGSLPGVTITANSSKGSTNNASLQNSKKVSNSSNLNNSQLTNTSSVKGGSNSVQATVNRYAMNNTLQGDFGLNRAVRRGASSIKNGFINFFNYLNNAAASNPNNRNKLINVHGYYQQGGTMNNQEELQKAFMAYLIQDAAAQGVQLQSEQDLQAYAQQLGEEGIKAKYQEFMQRMQGGVMARLGAKLNYYKKLKGVCPEGEELVYFKLGGRICKACQKSKKEQLNEVEQFKAARCGAKMKKKK